jgi:four helix bundle protein
MPMEVYTRLLVWQRAIELVVEVYRLTARFPKSELYGLSSQARRAAISIPSNIAEGRRRSTKKDYASFLAVADGSLAELETQLVIGIKLGYLTKTDCDAAFGLAEEVGKMLVAMRQKLS